MLALAGLCGSVIGLLFERLLVWLLAPVLPAELPTAGLWPWVWSMGSLVLISLLVGVRPYRQLLATQPLRVLRRDVAANVWPLRYFIPVMLLVVIGLLALLMGELLLWAILGAWWYWRCCSGDRLGQLAVAASPNGNPFITAVGH